MRVIVATILSVAALVATSTHAAPGASKARSSGRSHETPTENVRKSQWYDHLLTANASFRAYRTRKECDPIVNDRDLRNDCIRSFDIFEPFRPRSKRRA
jgi:hypothetical protein